MNSQHRHLLSWNDRDGQEILVDLAVEIKNLQNLGVRLGLYSNGLNAMTSVTIAIQPW